MKRGTSAKVDPNCDVSLGEILATCVESIHSAARSVLKGQHSPSPGGEGGRRGRASSNAPQCLRAIVEAKCDSKVSKLTEGGENFENDAVSKAIWGGN